MLCWGGEYLNVYNEIFLIRGSIVGNCIWDVVGFLFFIM